MAKKAASGARRPEKVFRVGFVSASIFIHEVQNGDETRSIRSVNIQKRYVDGEDVKYTSSFGLAELPQALHVLQLAANWVSEKEADVDLA